MNSNAKKARQSIRIAGLFECVRRQNYQLRINIFLR